MHQVKANRFKGIRIAATLIGFSLVLIGCTSLYQSEFKEYPLDNTETQEIVIVIDEALNTCLRRALSEEAQGRLQELTEDRIAS